MAVDKKAIAAMGRKKKAKMPKASIEDLKAIEVAGFGKGGRTDALINKLFRGTAYGPDGAFFMYQDFREKGLSPLKAYSSVFEASRDETN